MNPFENLSESELDKFAEVQLEEGSFPNPIEIVPDSEERRLAKAAYLFRMVPEKDHPELKVEVSEEDIDIPSFLRRRRTSPVTPPHGTPAVVPPFRPRSSSVTPPSGTPSVPPARRTAAPPPPPPESRTRFRAREVPVEPYPDLDFDLEEEEEIRIREDRRGGCSTRTKVLLGLLGFVLVVLALVFVFVLIPALRGNQEQPGPIQPTPIPSWTAVPALQATVEERQVQPTAAPVLPSNTPATSNTPLPAQDTREIISLGQCAALLDTYNVWEKLKDRNANDPVIIERGDVYGSCSEAFGYTSFNEANADSEISSGAYGTMTHEARRLTAEAIVATATRRPTSTLQASGFIVVTATPIQGWIVVATGEPTPQG